MKILASLTLLFMSCSPENGVTPTNMDLQTSGRIKVTLLNQFRDETAYHYVRGIYLITDTETGKEFIGISGIGISELGEHPAPVGKIITSHPDER